MSAQTLATAPSDLTAGNETETVRRSSILVVLLVLIGLLAAAFTGAGTANAATAHHGHHGHHHSAGHHGHHHGRKHHHRDHHGRKHHHHNHLNRTHKAGHARVKAVQVHRTPVRVTGTDPAPTSAEATMAADVLHLLNQERAANNLPALRMNDDLITSAHRHNLAMAADDLMSHQLTGEADLGTRVADAGYNWDRAGENIGWNSDMTTAGVLTLENMMYNEVAPNDGHRQNILSGDYRDIGIDIYLDNTNHKVWLTTDFGHLM